MKRLLPLALMASPVLAHEGELHARDYWNGATAVVLALLLVLYARGAFRSRPRSWQVLAFLGGWISAVIALLSPLDRLSDILFSAHMAQHEILMLVAAPLLVLGKPLVVMLWAFGAGTRARIGAFVRRPVVAGTWERITGPLFVLILHAVVLWVWHVPVLFEAALDDEAVHVFQHLGFFVTAALFWWALIHGRYGRVGYGVGVAYVFATAMHAQILGALLTFGRRVWYPTHAARTGAAALDDQQLAGVVMWVPFGVIFVLIGLALFAAWLGEAERRVAFTTAGRLGRDA
jgi:putative membrane protein